MFGFIRDFKGATLTFVLLLIIFVSLVIPLTFILPEPFHQFIPWYLQQISIIDYIRNHEEIILGSAITITLLSLILYLWRKK
jgi:hypothetical protein